MIFLIGIVGYYGCNSSPEKNESISIDATLDTTLATIGDVIKFSVEVRGLSHQILTFSELKLNNSVEVRNTKEFPQKHKIQHEIVFWDTGSFEIPPYIVFISHPEDTTRDFSLETSPLTMTVLSTFSGGMQSTLKPIKEPVPIDKSIPWLTIVQISFLILSIITMLFIWSRREISHSFAPAQFENNQSPFNKAKERLETLDNKSHDKLFYVTLSHTLREFVEHSIFIKSLEMTTHEIQSNESKIPMDKSKFRQWITLLFRADEIKFAKQETSKTQREEDLKWSHDFLDWARKTWKLV